MTHKKKIKFYSILSSLGIHLAILFLILINFHFFIASPSAQINSEEVHTYLYHPHAVSHKTLTLDQRTSLSTKTLSSLAPSTAHQAQISDPLLTLLNAAIQAQQIYPPSALEMQREGRVSVSFNLSPNGNIANLQLMHSSGTTSLDQAGLEAVRRASPIQGVSSYLTEAKDFKIDVVFHLN